MHPFTISGLGMPCAGALSRSWCSVMLCLSSASDPRPPPHKIPEKEKDPRHIAEGLALVVAADPVEMTADLFVRQSHETV